MQSVWPRRDDVALLDERRRARLGRAVEGADHRRLDAHEAVRGRARQATAPERGRRPSRRRGRAPARRRRSSVRRTVTRRSPSSTVISADAGLLDDAHDLADALGARLVDRAADERLVAAPRGRGSSRSSGSASSPKSASRISSSSLEARPSASSRSSSKSRPGSAGSASAVQRDGALDVRVDRCGRRAEAALHQLAELVDDRGVALGGEHVQQRLGGEHLADRRGERRRARLAADALQLVEHLVDPVAGRVRAQVRVEGGDEAGGQAVLRRAHGDARRERRHGLVADVLVHELATRQSASTSTRGPDAEPVERLGERLSARRGGAVSAIGKTAQAIAVGAGAGSLERGGERVARSPLAVEPDREPAGLAERADQLVHEVRLERARRVVQQDARRAEVREPARLLDERVSRRQARAVDRGRRRTRARAA